MIKNMKVVGINKSINNKFHGKLVGRVEREEKDSSIVSLLTLLSCLSFVHNNI